MGPKLQFVFRNFPLTNAHPHAQQAAEAAESAGAQGKFWDMHDAIYEHQRELSTEGLLGLGESIGIDTVVLRSDLETGRFEDRVYDDFMSGARSGVNGTPSFFINGVRYDGDWDYETLIAVLQQVAVQSK
jgi:protein-disulfide isomerase